MMMPSMSMCGLFCMSSRSLKVPGSDSSALHTRYLSTFVFGMNEIFLPLGKPAPPRPRRPEASNSSSTVWGVISVSARRAIS